MISTPAPVTSRAVSQHVEDLRLHGDVQRGGGFVADQQVRIVGDRDRDHHPLALAAGELVREAFARRSGCAMPTSSSSSTARVRARARLMPRLWTAIASAIWSPTV